MANPQKEDGHTGIANELLEKIYSIPLSGSEFRTIFYIIRKTWGWHKKQDKISLSQIVTNTKLSRKQVCEVINKLVTKRLLFKEKKNINIYKFNKDYDQWVVTNRLLGSYRTVNKVVTKTKPKVVTEMEHTKETIKETITKETIPTVLVALPQKEFGNPNINKIMDTFQQLYESKPSPEKEQRRYCSNLIKKYTLEKILNAIKFARQCVDQRYAPAICTPKDLYYKWNNLKIYYTRKIKEGPKTINEE